MTCDVSEEQLWSWIDRTAPELEEHLAVCPRCRARAEEMRGGIETIAVGSAQPSVPLPERIGSYVIKRLLGEGGQALVYEAEQQSPRRSVALKVLKGGRLVGEHHIRHFRRESQALASLKHPAIATIYEAGRTEEGQHFFAMELVAGEPLDVYVREKDVSLEKRLELFGQVCEAVHYAHQHGVIHRDLKPSNILVDAEGKPKILDLGLARITDADVTLTTTASGIGQIVGTLRYMSPEQACGRSDEVGEQSDVYALGVILYELLTDQRPYDVSKSIPEAVATICEKAPAKPSDVNRALRGDLETIVLKALAKEPSQRYESVEEIGEDVRRYLSNEPVLAKRPTTLYVLRKKVSKHRVAFGVVTAVVLLGLIGLSAAMWRKQHELTEGRRWVLRIQRELERDRLGAGKPVVTRAAAAFEAYPELPEARLVWAQARFRAGREVGDEHLVGAAMHTLRGGPLGGSSQWAFRALMADMYRITGNPKARQLQAEADREMPDTAQAWYLRSFATLDTDEAVRSGEEAVKRDPKHALAWERLACLYVRTQDFDGAVRASRSLMGLEVDRFEWLMFEAHVFARQARYGEAAEQYTRLIARDPTRALLYRHRAVAYLCQREYAKAIEDYTKAVKMGDAPWGNYQRATPLWIMGRRDEAAAAYRGFRTLEDRASYADARLFLVLQDEARHLHTEGRFREASEAVKEASDALQVGRRGAAPPSWLDKVFGCLAGDLAPADLVAAADHTDPEQVCEAYYYAGEAYRLAGQTDKAQECFQNCVGTGLVFDHDESPPDPMSEYHLARWRLEQLGADTRSDLSPEEE